MSKAKTIKQTKLISEISVDEQFKIDHLINMLLELQRLHGSKLKIEFDAGCNNVDMKVYK